MSSAPTEDDLCALFAQIGFEDKKIKEIIKNNKVSNSLFKIINISNGKASSSPSPIEKSELLLFHQLATLLKGKENELDDSDLEIICDNIKNKNLTSNLQVSEALKYIETATPLNMDDFKVASGIGIKLSDEEVKTIIQDYLNADIENIKINRYRLIPSLLANVRQLQSLKWASPALFKPIIDEEILKICGPKDERDVIKKEKKKKQPASSSNDSKKDSKDSSKGDEKVRNMFTEGFLGDLHKPGEEPQKWDDTIQEHRKFINGQVFTRFPPEPNGFLHIGHSKAIMVNFGYAKYHNGKCYLRYDDTNPEAEEQVYFDSILRCVKWLGFKPWKITYSSDYFDQLYELAERLINSGYAYVDHSTPEQVKAQRGVKEDGTPGGERFPSPWRDRTVEENLTEFRKMRDGFYKPGEATLRMKQDIKSPSPQMWDLVAYRVLNASHPRTGDKWKIYPTYDFTHCLVDSFENITHSLCTTEFYLSRESYEWLCDVLHVYRPAQREYGRLNITGTIMSKRKIAKLVNEKYVRGWNDPRLYTLESLRRRGVPPGAILSFINTLGVTTSTTNIQVTRFESAVRQYLDVTTPRLMMIENPIKVVLENVDDDFEELVEMPYKPGNEAFGSRTIPLTKTLYIDSSDYRDETSKGYFRLAPNQPVGLMKVPFNIQVKSVDYDSNNKPILIHAEYLNKPELHKKPKAYIQWIPESKKYNSPVRIDEVRVYNQLFNSENPSSHPDGFLADINKDSESVVKGALIEPAILDIKSKSPLNMPFTDEKFNIKEEEGVETVRFQALRVGYFCLDTDSTDDKLILNRIVTLKEDADKD